MNESIRSRLRRHALAGAAAALLAGCADVSMKPYQRPDTPAKAAWSRQQTLPIAPAEMITVDWWKQFRDPYLNGLVDCAAPI
jgi:outer membrane protein TolC